MLVGREIADKGRKRRRHFWVVYDVEPDVEQWCDVTAAEIGGLR